MCRARLRLRREKFEIYAHLTTKLKILKVKKQHRHVLELEGEGAMRLPAYAPGIAFCTGTRCLLYVSIQGTYRLQGHIVDIVPQKSLQYHIVDIVPQSRYSTTKSSISKSWPYIDFVVLYRLISIWIIILKLTHLGNNWKKYESDYKYNITDFGNNRKGRARHLD